MARPHATLILTLLLLCSLPAAACEIRVRDAAFRTPRDIHRLCVIANSDDPDADAIAARLEDWLAETAQSLNLKLVRVTADDPDTDWDSFGIPSAPLALPVTVLFGRSNSAGESFVIDHWEPEPDEADLAALLTSPVRKQLQERLGQHIAVLLYSGGDNADPATAAMLRDLVGKDIKDERIGLSLIEFDASDPAEQLLSSFIGLPPDGPSTLVVAFGQAKLMEPPLYGAEITRESVSELISLIRQACSCSKPLPTIGLDLPIVWTPELDSLTVLMDVELEDEELSDDTVPTASEASDDVTVLLSERPTAPASRSLLMPALWTLGGLVMIAGICSFVWTGRRP